jgi:hypothetical protein
VLGFAIAIGGALALARFGELTPERERPARGIQSSQVAEPGRSAEAASRCVLAR